MIRRGRIKAGLVKGLAKGLSLALLLCGLTAASPPPAALAAEAQSLRAQMLYVNDGDTVTVVLAGRRELVRILGIDAPETDHSVKLERAARRAGRSLEQEAALGRQARQRLAALAPPGAEVVLESDPDVAQRDQYGRLLAYLRLPDGRQAGAVMVAEGLARVFRRCGCGQLAELSRLERQARARGLGFWAGGRP
jgi:micrococcal nuclease